MAAGQVRTVGKSLESTFVATGEDGVSVTVYVMRLKQVVETWDGTLEPITNPGVIFQLENGTRVYPSQPDGTLLVDRSNRMLTAPVGSYPT